MKTFLSENWKKIRLGRFSLIKTFPYENSKNIFLRRFSLIKTFPYENWKNIFLRRFSLMKTFLSENWKKIRLGRFSLMNFFCPWTWKKKGVQKKLIFNFLTGTPGTWKKNGPVFWVKKINIFEEYLALWNFTRFFFHYCGSGYVPLWGRSKKYWQKIKIEKSYMTREWTLWKLIYHMLDSSKAYSDCRLDSARVVWPVTHK